MPSRFLTLLLLPAFAFAIAPVPKAAKTTQDLVVGAWELVMSRGERPSSRHIITFTRDGIMTIDVGTAPNIVRYTGKYKIVNDGIDYVMNSADYQKAELLKIKLLNDSEMRTTDPEGIDEHFVRLRD